MTTSESSRSTSRRGLLLVGHGTRSQQGVAEFLQTARLIAERVSPVHVEPAFLELASPTIADALWRMRQRELDELVVVPLLLFAAGHAKQDIPQSVSDSLSDHVPFTVRQAEPLGCHPKILDAAAQRFRETVGDDNPFAMDDTLLLLVGRGSSDPEAVQETRRFASLLAAQCSVPQFETAFLSVAQPSVTDCLGAVRGSRYRRIVVQPHLLFTGELLGELQVLVSQARSLAPDKTWMLASHLGPCLQVAEAAVARYHETSADSDG